MQFYGRRYIAPLQLSKQLLKMPFSLTTPQLDEAMDQDETLLSLLFGHSISTKVPFVRMGKADWTISGIKEIQYLLNIFC